MNYSRLASILTSSLLVFAAMAPWGGVFFLPQEAFAQVGSITGAAKVPTAQASPALRNVAAEQGGTVSWSQGAASGAVSIGACLAAGGISIGAGIAAAFAAVGITSLFGGGTPVPPQPVPESASGPRPPEDPDGIGYSFPGKPKTPTAPAGPPVPVEDEKVKAELKELNKTTAAILAIQTAQLVQISALQGKESMLDCIAWALAKMIWRAIAASIIDWINNGFNGRPAFIQDYQRFFLGIADRAIGSVIESDQYLAFLCSPFQLTIRIALAMRYANRAPTCTLTSIINNVENFARSFQSGGGWPAWLQFSVVPVNNAYGAYLASEVTLSFTYQTKLGSEKFEKGISSGFLAQKKQIGCTGNQKPGEGSCREIILTPGEIISRKAAQVVGGGETQLLLADEFNEILDALVVQLLSKALNSLFGLSQSNSYQDDYYRGSYTDSLSGTATTGGADSDGTVLGEINNTIAIEQEYQSRNNQAIQMVEGVQQQFGQVAACWHDKETGKSSPPLADTNDRAQAGVEGRTVDFSITALERRKQPYKDIVAQSGRNVEYLQTLSARATAATTQTELQAVLQDLNGTRSLSDYVQPSDLTRVSTELTSLQVEFSSYNSQIANEMNRCQYFPRQAPGVFDSLFPAGSQQPTQ